MCMYRSDTVPYAAQVASHDVLPSTASAAAAAASVPTPSSADGAPHEAAQCSLSRVCRECSTLPPQADRQRLQRHSRPLPG